MKNRKFLYIYTDQDEMIQEIKTSAKDKAELNEYLIPVDQGEEFLALKEKWNQAYGYKEPHILLSNDGQFCPQEVMYVYYEKKKNTIKSIGSATQEYLDKDKNLIQGKTKRTPLIDGFMDKKPFHNYKVKEGSPLLEFVEQDLNQEVEFKDMQLLKRSKIDFIEKGREIELRYDRKRKELLVHSVYKLPSSSIWLHFTKKNDRTVLYHSVNVKLEGETTLISNIDLPETFDVYSPLHNEHKFLYKEENGKRRNSRRSVNE